MKNILITVLLTTCVCGVNHFEHNYTRETCEVVKINNGIATIEDKCGYHWKYADSNLKVGDIVDLKMNDNCTVSNIEDDVITKIVKR